jgi:two-component system chemotaxis response regulator CheB
VSAAEYDRGEAVVPEHIDIEIKIAKEQNPLEAGVERLGSPSLYACPECHGVLLQVKEGETERFRCHTGHAYSLESLLGAINEGIHEALSGALRALEEGGLLLQRVAAHLQQHANARDAARFAGQATDMHGQSEVLRQLIMGRERIEEPTK